MNKLQLIPLSIEGAWLFTSPAFVDDRGYFVESFKSDFFKEKLGFSFDASQANLSRSKKGVIRGIHFSFAPEGQAKWITCANGSLWDVVVDIRPKSPTYGKWEAHELKAGDGKSIYIGSGLGHAFLALEDQTVISYLLSSPYSPGNEFAINPLDPEIGIAWPLSDISVSTKDKEAPTMSNFYSNRN